MTIADNILNLISKLDFKGTLPSGISIFNPYMDGTVKGLPDNFT